MNKGNKKKTENLIPNNTHGTKNNVPSLSETVLKDCSKELYLELLTYLKNLTIRPTSVTSREYIIRLATNLFESNTTLFEQFVKKYNNSLSHINTLYEEYLNTTSLYNQAFESELNDLESKLNDEIQVINEGLMKYQQEAIAKSKAVENDFIPKANFLKLNKKINKDEYIKIVREINEHRISTNQKYLETASDLSNINEQQQLKFKHSIEAAIEKNKYDITILNQDALEKTLFLDETLETKTEKSKQYIQTKERKIIQNSIELNELITKISNEYANRIKFAYVPYDIKENKLLDELSENNTTYNTIEGQVLDEFKTLLQQNDNEIEDLRQNHREFKEKYLLELKEIKKELNSAYQKQIYLLNKDLAVAVKNYNANKTKENKTLVKKLTEAKKKCIASFQLEKKKRLAKVKKEYYLKELNFIERFEKLRTKKSQCEAIKSSAIKNINYERAYHHDRINSEIRLNTREKESYSTTDHYEESIDIYKNHLKVDIENEEIRHIINEEEVEIYTNSINIKYQQDKIIAERDYNIKLSEADLIYQKESTNNRINYFNVKTMLEIQKENIINQYEVLFSNEKMDFERTKNIFYNNCDNIQYELYKAETELKYKLIDNDLEHETNLGEIKKNHLKVLNNINKQHNSINKMHSDNILRLKLYKDRLDAEKNILTEIFKFYTKSFGNIIDFESYLYNTIPLLPLEDFEANKKHLIIILEYLRKIKLRITENYFNEEIDILKNRSNFEKHIKFKKQIDELNKKYDDFIANSKYRIEKNNQTIASYKNTINISLEAFKTSKKNLNGLNLKLIMNLFNRTKINSIRKEIKSNRENEIIIKKLITANRKNITKLKRVGRTLNSERKNQERKFISRIHVLEKNQFNETKIYSDLISLVKLQYNKLCGIINECGSYTSISKYTYNVLTSTANSIQKINNSVLTFAKNFFDIHFNTFNDKLSNQYTLKNEMYKKNNEKYLKEIQKSINIAIKEYETNQTTLNNAYKSKKDSLIEQNNYTKNKLLQELKKMNTTFILEVLKHNKNMTKISKDKEYELSCHNENVSMYVDIYNNNNTKIINKYLLDIKKIKTNYFQEINKLEIKYKESLRRIKAQHISNETLKKNNILNYEMECKERINMTLGKIKRINQSDHKAKQNHDETRVVSYSLYLQNQRNTRREFSAQLSAIEKKCQKRIKTLKKEFIKEFNKKND